VRHASTTGLISLRDMKPVGKHLQKHTMKHLLSNTAGVNPRINLCLCYLSKQHQCLKPLRSCQAASCLMTTVQQQVMAVAECTAGCMFSSTSRVPRSLLQTYASDCHCVSSFPSMMFAEFAGLLETVTVRAAPPRGSTRPASGDHACRGITDANSNNHSCHIVADPERGGRLVCWSCSSLAEAQGYCLLTRSR
jgi:hypothetical protein